MFFYILKTSPHYLLSLVGKMGLRWVQAGKEIIRRKMDGRWFLECIVAFLPSPKNIWQSFYFFFLIFFLNRWVRINTNKQYKYKTIKLQNLRLYCLAGKFFFHQPNHFLEKKILDFLIFYLFIYLFYAWLVWKKKLRKQKTVGQLATCDNPLVVI